MALTERIARVWWDGRYAGDPTGRYSETYGVRLDWALSHRRCSAHSTQHRAKRTNENMKEDPRKG